MPNNFKAFAAAVAARFQLMSQHELFVTSVSGDDLWQLYLDSFPPGTNPIFRVRTEHDGSYDRHTIRRIGNVIAIVDGLPVSIWDAPNLPAPYGQVAEVLADRVRRSAVVTIFRTRESRFGFESTIERQDDGSSLTFNHFHVAIAKRHQSSDVGTVLGEALTSVQVFKRGLEELKPAALADIKALIEENNLYRGQEHLNMVNEFIKLQTNYLALPFEGGVRQAFLWQNYTNFAARFRNTVIGSLAIDLSAGTPLEDAVKSFEQKVAPTNYKRTSALITQSMVNQALAKINDLGLEPALERRYATPADLSVNNVLWVNNQTQARMKDGLAGLLADAVTRKEKANDQAEPITIDQFLATIAPQARSIEALVENRMQRNLMALIAPVHSDSAPLFKWPNNFAWSYNGDITDAIKERVKAAGGNVKADLRISLAWFNHDDLDLHAECPYGHVYYGAKAGGGTGNWRSATPQILDVDMNAGSGYSRSPVENLAFNNPRPGRYQIQVRQFANREIANPGFVLELEHAGVIQQFSYSLQVRQGETIDVIAFDFVDNQIKNLTVVSPRIQTQGLSQKVWNISTESFVPVTMILNSPNHWDEQAVGNKHTFLILEGCANPEATRGIYNEFLRSDLNEHRKVFEILGNKTKCAPAADQLAGIGFSSTVRDTVTVRVTGPTINKKYQIQF